MCQRALILVIKMRLGARTDGSVGNVLTTMQAQGPEFNPAAQVKKKNVFLGIRLSDSVDTVMDPRHPMPTLSLPFICSMIEFFFSPSGFWGLIPQWTRVSQHPAWILKCPPSQAWQDGMKANSSLSQICEPKTIAAEPRSGTD